MRGHPGRKQLSKEEKAISRPILFRLAAADVIKNEMKGGVSLSQFQHRRVMVDAAARLTVLSRTQRNHKIVS